MTRWPRRKSKGKRKPRVDPLAKFDRVAAFEFACDRFAEPHGPGERRPKSGTCVVRCVIPLHFAPTLNVLAEMHNFIRSKIKRGCEQFMFAQLGRRVGKQGGHPIVLMCRFTSAPKIDHDVAFTKIPLDRLVRLGFIDDDSTDAIDLIAWKEKAPPGKGCVYMEVWHD